MLDKTTPEHKNTQIREVEGLNHSLLSDIKNFKEQKMWRNSSKSPVSDYLALLSSLAKQRHNKDKLAKYHLWVSIYHQIREQINALGKKAKSPSILSIFFCLYNQPICYCCSLTLSLLTVSVYSDFFCAWSLGLMTFDLLIKKMKLATFSLMSFKSNRGADCSTEHC